MKLRHLSAILSGSLMLVAGHAWSAQPGEKRINHRGDQTITRVSAPAVRQLPGGDVVVERVETRFLAREERGERFEQVGTRQVPGQETVHTPVASPERAPGVPQASVVESGITRTQTTLSTRRETRQGRPGTVVTATTTRSTLNNLQVALVWRNITSNWIANLQSRYIERDTHGGVPGWLNDELIAAAYERDGWRSVLASIQAGRSGLLMIDLDTGRVLGQVVDHTMGMTEQNSRTGIQDFRLSDGSTVRADLRAWSTHGSPIVLDLAGKGTPDLLAGPAWKFTPDRRVATSALRAFDLDGTGRARWEWVGPGSGLLVWDPDRTGRITSGRQLFGNWTWGKPWKDGYEPLATLDRDHDGSLSGPELAALGVWIDADGDGVSDPGEVSDCASAGVQRIGVGAERDASGHAMLSAGFTMRLPEGRTVERRTWDWISMGLANAREGTYVWVDGQGPGARGGILQLQDHAGTLKGLSIPTSDVALLDHRVIPAFVLHGRFRDPARLSWSYAIPGGQVISEVKLLDRGERLIGSTRVIGEQGESSYTWQAQRVAGRPIGPAVTGS